MASLTIDKLNIGGIIVAYDTLSMPLDKKKKFANYMDQYNRFIFLDKRLISTILPVGDGVTISVKISEK